ncbi:MAG: hypothetical protein HOW73_35580 [Polyangiaceae bacterium]|nr:hypothetical protein [Polyangiaceae bacterium]
MKLSQPVFAASVTALLIATSSAHADEVEESGKEEPAKAEPAKEEPGKMEAVKGEPPQPAIPVHRIQYDATLGVRVNPLGLELQSNLAYRHRLYASDSRALRDNYFGVALSPTLNPSVFRIGGHIEFRPLTMLNLQAGVHHVGYIGSFDNLQSYPVASADFSDTARDEGDKKGKSYPTHGFEAFGRAIALAKVGPIVIRDDLLFTFSKLELMPGDTVYYNPRFDVLAPNEGWFLHNDSDVVYMSDFGLLAGARASVTHAFYDDKIMGTSASEDNVPMFRLGPILAYTIFDTPGAAFNKPTFIASAQWWLQHRFRTGEDVHQGIPYAIVAFRFEGDLFRGD